MNPECVKSCDEIERIENYVPCCDTNDDLEQRIIEAVAKRQKRSEDSDSDENASQQEHVTYGEANKAIDALRRYFMQDGNEGAPMPALDTCADFVELQSAKRLRQAKLVNFFQRK